MAAQRTGTHSRVAVLRVNRFLRFPASSAQASSFAQRLRMPPNVSSALVHNQPTGHDTGPPLLQNKGGKAAPTSWGDQIPVNISAGLFVSEVSRAAARCTWAEKIKAAARQQGRSNSPQATQQAWRVSQNDISAYKVSRAAS